MTSNDAAPKEALPRSTSPSGRPAPPQSVTAPDEPRETTASPNPETPPPAPPSDADRLVAVWKLARLSAGHGDPYGPRAEPEFRDSAAILLRAGKPLAWLEQLAQWMGAAKPSWANLAGAATAQQMGAPAEPAAVPQQRSFTKCPECDPEAPVPTHYRDPENGLGPYRCPNTVLAPV